MIKNRGYEVYVGNLDEQVTEEMLYNFFASCGMITSVKIMRHIVTHKSRGFGFVNFARREDALYAKDKFNGKKIITNKLNVYLKDKFKSLDKQANIVVSNLAVDITEEELKKLCQDFGPVFSVKVLEGEDPANGSKRALVLFENLQAAQTCIEGLNGFTHRGSKLLVEASVKKDVMYIKGPFNTDIKEDLTTLLASWGSIEVGNVEKIDDGRTYLTTLKFQDELTAKSFLQEYRSRKEDCKLIRPNN